MTRDSPVRQIPFLRFSPTWVAKTVFLWSRGAFLNTFEREAAARAAPWKLGSIYRRDVGSASPLPEMLATSPACALKKCGQRPYNGQKMHQLMRKEAR